MMDGIIFPTSWDAQGDPTEYSLFTFDEKEFKIVSAHGADKRLFEYSRKRVRVAFRRKRGRLPMEGLILEDLYEID